MNGVCNMFSSFKVGVFATQIRIMLLAFTLVTSTTPAQADSSSPRLASYYERHMALQGDVAYGWVGRGQPVRMMAGVMQLGVSDTAFFALLADGTLQTWTNQPARATTLMRGVKRFAAGASGWFAIDTAGVLWHSVGGAAAQRIAENVIDVCIGDSADYYIRQGGALYAKGLAHRGQYGDGKLTATNDFVATAQDAAAVRAHTGHGIYLRQGGTVMGTGGNRFGPLSSHGLGDKADRWGAIFQGAVAIATGSRHSLAIRADGSLWAWGAGFAIEPAKLLDNVADVAAGDTVTLARTRDGTLWQWDAGNSQAPRRLSLPL
jgi:alpha-tubulin suppressor-like RCC1 family protein